MKGTLRLSVAAQGGASMTPTVSTRVVAAIIFASGATAAVLLFLSAGRFAPIRVLFPVAAIPPLLFWLSVSGAGLWLWRGSARSRIVAGVLLASQIPVIVADGFTYWWHTPAQVALTLQRVADQTLVGVTTKLGPAVSVWIGRPSSSTTVGINLLAIICLVVLLRATRSSRPGREV
jgi:hypothetical protein